MARYMKKSDVIEMAVEHFPSFLRSRQQAKVLNSWVSGTQYEYSEDLDPDDRAYGRPFSPRQDRVTSEYENLRGLSPNNFAGLIVTTMQQMAYLEGISRPGVIGKLPVWDTFRRNRWLSRQAEIHRAALGQSVAYGVVLPGRDPLTGSSMARMYGKSPTRMAGFYDDDDDEWPVIAIEATRVRETGPAGGVIQSGWLVRIYDSWVIHNLSCKGDGATAADWTYIDFSEHRMPVPPVARCANRIDLEGSTHGVIEPVLPILRRIDQDTFDRLINQRFGAWQVRYIAGMAKPTSQSEQAAQSLRLRVEDLLISTNPETKFGTMPAGSIENQIKATDHDLRMLSAIAQMPPHHLLGLSSNLQAEALAAATEGLQRNAFSFRNNAGEFHEQMARLVAMADGDLETANAWDLRARWRDTESASMTQAADSLGKFAQMLGVPLEMLWERIPGWTDDDVERAKELAADGTLETLIQELVSGSGATQPPASDPLGGLGDNLPA